MGSVVSRSLGNEISVKDSKSGYSTFQRILPKFVRSMPGVELEQMGFDEDHMHFVTDIPPKYAIADVMGELTLDLRCYCERNSIF